MMAFVSPLDYRNGVEEDLLYNFKKPMYKKPNPLEWRHKEKAIREIADIFKNSVFDKFNNKQTIVIPIPPSKIVEHDGHDDRVVQLLKIALKENIKVTYRDDILIQTESYPASHENDGNRISKEKLESIYEIKLDALDLNIEQIIIFDDVITSGAHFRAVCNKLEQGLGDKFQEYDIKGLFIGRKIHEESDNDFII